MPLNVISNYAANVAHRNLVKNDAAETNSLAKLSAGTRVVSARDDAASLAIGSRLNAEVQALQQASVNAGQAISMLQVADGAMARVSDILVRMKVLSVQASSGQLSNTERGMLNTEYQQLLSEIDRIAKVTTFNGNQLVNGASATSTILNGQTNANNLIQAADGFANIQFDPTVGNAAISVSYDSATNVLTLTNLTTGTSQGVNINSTAIGTGQTQPVRFDNLGISVTLNSAFDKAANIKPTGTATINNGGSIDTTTIAVTGADAAAAVEALASKAISFDLTAAATAKASLGAFTANNIALNSVGTKNITLSDGTDTIDVKFTVTGVFSNGATLTVNADQLGSLAFGNSSLSSTTSFSFKVGTGTTVGVDTLTISINAIDGGSLSLANSDILTSTNADGSQALVTAAIDRLNNARANVGAAQNRLDFAAANLSTAVENGEAARSNLLDLDVAQEMTTLTSRQILVQSGMAMLAQANQMPKDLLRLFQ